MLLFASSCCVNVCVCVCVCVFSEWRNVHSSREAESSCMNVTDFTKLLRNKNKLAALRKYRDRVDGLLLLCEADLTEGTAEQSISMLTKSCLAGIMF